MAESGRPQRINPVLLLIAFALAAWACLWGPITTPLVDPFHEGEYLSTGMLLAPGLTPPLLIHGVMDYLPSAIADHLFGPARSIAGTRVINLIAAQLACFAFIAGLLALARSRAGQLAALLIAFAVLFWINARAQTIVMLQQGSPSVRDLPLMVMLWLLVLAVRSEGKRADWLATLAALLAGIGWAWAYNRGLLMLAAVPAYAVGAWWDGRSRRHLLWLGAGLGAGLALHFALEPRMWAQHFANALYWARNQGVWSGPIPLSLTLRNMPFYLLGAAALALGGWLGLRGMLRRGQGVPMALLLPLGLVAAGSYVAIFNRPDPPHLMFAVPALVMLAFAAWTGLAEAEPDQGWPATLRRNAVLLASLAAILIVDFSAQTGSGTIRPVIQGLGKNLLTLARGLPNDEAVMEPRLRQVTALLRAGPGQCTYVLDNSGAIYRLSGLRSCSPIMLPTYATPQNESAIIADLERARPPLIVGRSNYWTDAIDGKGLDERTPELARWVARNYAPETTIEGIAVLRRVR